MESVDQQWSATPLAPRGHTISRHWEEVSEYQRKLYWTCYCVAPKQSVLPPMWALATSLRSAWGCLVEGFIPQAKAEPLQVNLIHLRLFLCNSTSHLMVLMPALLLEGSVIWNHVKWTVWGGLYLALFIFLCILYHHHDCSHSKCLCAWVRAFSVLKL